MSRRQKHRQPYELQAEPAPAPAASFRLAEYSTDAIVVAAAICFGVAIKQAIGPWAVWLYAGLSLLLLGYAFVNTQDDDDGV